LARNVVWLCKVRQFRHGFPGNGHCRQAAHPENYFRKTRMAVVPLQNFAAIEKLSTQIRHICGYKTSIDAKFYRFVSGYAISLRSGDGSFSKFPVIRNLRICGAAVEMLLYRTHQELMYKIFEELRNDTETFYGPRQNTHARPAKLKNILVFGSINSQAIYHSLSKNERDY
jgi:hypothetical protein